MLQAGDQDQPRSPDEILAFRASQGAFTELVSRYEDRIYRLAIRMCRNSADAEEVCQETFRLAYGAMSSFQGDSSIGTWLYRIATNEALMRRRAAARRPVGSIELIKESGGGWGDCTVGGEPVEGADELLHRKLLTQRVLGALAQLDEPHRAALVLHDLEERSADEAAEILGISAGTLRQRAHRARVRLRAQLGVLQPPAP
jgi:RNA polymerase sigma-70 factor (ECF subfamily)